MKFAVMRLACCLSRQQTLCRAIAVASRIVHGALHLPPTCFGVESPLRWWLDPGRMRSLTDGVPSDLHYIAVGIILLVSAGIGIVVASQIVVVLGYAG